MKNTIIFVTALLLLVNIVAGLLLSKYSCFNIVLTSVIIAVTGIMLVITSHMQIKSAFKISLTFLTLLSFIIMFTLGLLSPQRIQDNLSLIAIVILFVIEIICIILISSVYKHNNKK